MKKTTHEGSDEELFGKIFPEFDKLHEDEKIVFLEEIRKRSNLSVERTKNDIFGWKLFLWGVTFGIVGNLWASVLYDYFKKFGLYYIFFLSLFSLVVAIAAISSLVNNIDTRMSDDPGVRKIWDYTKENKKEQRFLLKLLADFKYLQNKAKIIFPQATIKIEEWRMGKMK